MKKLAMILAAIMLLSALSVSAFAAEGTTIYFDVNANWPDSGARFAVYYFGDAGNGWVDLTADGELYTATIPAGYDKMIICRMNPGAAENDWANKWNQTGDLIVPTDDKNCYCLPYGNWDGADNTNWYVKGQQPNNETLEGPVEYYVAGSAGLCGVDWKENAPENKMTLNADGLYEKVYENVPGGSYEFKITNGTWAESWGVDGNNYAFGGPDAQNVRILFNADTKEITVEFTPVEGEGQPAEPTYYVAGTAGLCGVEWAAAAEENKMTLNADGLYEKFYENVPAGDHEFKITNGTWDQSWGDNGQNVAFGSPVAHNVRILFNPATGEVTLETASAPTGDTSFVYGFALLMVVSAAAVVVLTKKKAV